VEDTMAHFAEREYFEMSPTYSEPFERETLDSLEHRLTTLWSSLKARGIDPDLLMAQSMLSPATCCLVNPDGEKTVEKAFTMVRELSARLREKSSIVEQGSMDPFAR